MSNNRNIFYVYLHRKATNKEVFYVGKGKGRRAKHIQQRNKWWNNIVEKHGFIVEYVEKDLSEEDAFELEKETIKFYKENGHILCNLSDGGEGPSGLKITEERRKQIREHFNKPEIKEKTKLALSRPVLCSNGMTFDSAADAQRWVCGKNGSGVNKTCRRERLSFGGFVWRYLDDCEDLKEILDKGLDAFVEWNCEQKSRIKKVYCSNGMIFANTVPAAEWMKSIGFEKVSFSSVWQVCNGDRTSIYGFKFSFKNEFSEIGVTHDSN